MHQLERLLPQHGKLTNHVYLASEDYVFPRASTPVEIGDETTVINDDFQLADVINNFRRVSNLKTPGAGKKIFENILRSTQFNLVFIKVDLTKWVNENRIDVRDITGSKYVVLREDNISDNNLSDLLNMFCSTAPMLQPQMIILPNLHKSTIEHRLRFANSNITVSWLDPGRPGNISIPRKAPSTIDEFAGLFDRRCFEAVARVSPKQLLDWSGNAPDMVGVAIRLARLRARILTAERADVEPEVDELLSDLDQMTDAGISTDTEPYLLTRSLALLQKTYCSEKPEFLNEALAISSTLLHELGVAMCLRYANFLSVHPALESHMLKRAEDIFQRNDCPELAIYCINNRLLSCLLVDGDATEGFSELMARVEAQAPTIHRRGDIQYNAGVEHLFSGRLASAFDTFGSINHANARPLIVACARLGAMICERLETGRANIDDAMNLIAFVRSNVAPSNRWHVTNLLLNAATLVRDRPDHVAAILHEAEGQIDLDGAPDVRDVRGENRLMATALGLDGYRGGAPVSGRFGRFFRQTGMALPFFFIWS
jgi:hypothetical protein